VSSIVASFVKSAEKQASKTAALKSSIKDLKGTLDLTAALNEPKAAKKKKVENNSRKIRMATKEGPVCATMSDPQPSVPTSLAQTLLTKQPYQLQNFFQLNQSNTLIAPTERPLPTMQPAFPLTAPQKMWLQDPNGEWKYLDV
jgi:hypothetical protein